MKRTILLIGILLLFSRYTEIYAATIMASSCSYSDVSDAIDNASDGDTVWVADGTYRGEGNRDIEFSGRAIVVRSEHGATFCIIDCEGTEGEPHQGFGFYSGEDSLSILEGFTICNGYALWWGGGGIGCATFSSPVIRKCVITNNSGGGISCFNSSSPTIENNTISNNSGGGINCYDSPSAIISNNFISGNTNDWGGGIYCNASSPIIRNNIIDGNSADCGGGISCDQESSPTVTNNIISSNTANGWGGGGIDCVHSSPIFNNNTIVNNSAGEWGGGIGAAEGSAVTVRDCIIWGNTASSGGAQILLDASSGVFTYSDIQGGVAGEGNIALDPCFERGLLGDYYLSFASPISPCINAGSRSAVEAGLSDQTTRIDSSPDDGIVDIGGHYPVSGWIIIAENKITQPYTLEITAYPNPFNSFCRISSPDGTEVEIFNLSGRKIERFPGGKIIWQPKKNIPSGVYLIYIKLGKKSVVRQIIYLK